MEFDEIDRLCARRTQDAMQKYGILDLPNDPRDFIKELKDELLDAINYARWAGLKGQLSKESVIEIVWTLKFVIICHCNKLLPKNRQDSSDRNGKPR